MLPGAEHVQAQEHVQETARAQEAALRGRVVDAADGTPLPGANVVLRSATDARGAANERGAGTDGEGRFAFEGLPAGAYHVRVSMIGYEAAERTVRLAAGRAETLRVALHVEAYDLAEVVVRGRRAGARASATATVQRVPLAAISRQDAAAVAGVMRLVPAAHVQTNSRGETLVYLRGAGERQVALFLDGALLNVPWDNRIDLSMIPAGVMGGMTVAKGVPSVRYGANVLGGAVNVTTRMLSSGGRRTELTGQGGYPQRGRASAVHLGRRGPLAYTAAAGYAAQDGFALPGGANLPYSQAGSRLRTNTDRRLAHAFARGAYAFGGARLGVTLLHIDAAKGIAPESHVNPSQGRVRYWRYPNWGRTMLIANGHVPLGARGRLRGAVWVDRFGQTIRQFRSAAYDRLQEEQRSTDYTAGTRLIWEQTTAGPGTLALALNAFTSQHRQTNLYFDENGALLPHVEGHPASAGGYPTDLYRQHVFSVGAEYDAPLTGRLRGTVGASLDGMAMPRTAGKPRRDPFYAYGLTSGLAYDLAAGWTLRAAAGRKARFPTMRELYGAALGKFKLNPDLRPESALLAEVGIEAEGARARGEATVFLNRTHDTIDQTNLPDGREQRINLAGSRVLGVEGAGRVRLRARWTLRGHLTGMHVRGFLEGEARRLQEKPAWLGALALAYDAPGGLALLVEPVYTGGIYAQREDNTFARLPASLVINARAAYRFLPPGPLADAEVFVRANNLTDAVALTQLGLPGPGRSFQAGLTVAL